LILLSSAVLLGVFVVACGLVGTIANRNVNLNNPPSELEQSAESVIVSLYANLKGGADVERLYPILEPEVQVYYLMGPPADHPAQIYEYRTGLYRHRWHAGVFPARRTTVDGKLYELWVVWYGGGGRWYLSLRQQRHCYVTVSDGLWSERRILYRFEVDPQPVELLPFDSVTLPGGRVIEFPPPPEKRDLGKN
jgi:hypothetical protein